MPLVPINDTALIEPKLRSAKFADEVMARSGLYMPKPENTQHSFEGIPNEGDIFALPADYSGELKVGMRVVFKENRPAGFKFDGHKLLPIKIDNIEAELLL